MLMPACVLQCSEWLNTCVIYYINLMLTPTMMIVQTLFVRNELSSIRKHYLWVRKSAPRYCIREHMCIFSLSILLLIIIETCLPIVYI